MKTAVIVFPGSNCDYDCYHAVKHVVGGDVDFVWHHTESLDGYDFVIIPGGFSYGDYLRPGAISRFSPVMGAARRFAESGAPILGICNGFQILTEAGLLPGALMRNESMKFICKDIWVRVETSDSFLTRGFDKKKALKMPIAHMEGRYTADTKTLEALNAEDRVLFRYSDVAGRVKDEANPNGSAENIAGILSEKRNVAGMMPHPERVCEESLGGVDGLLLFKSAMENLSVG